MNNGGNFNDPLANYSARDLCTALHWTSIGDLKKCIARPDDIDEAWENLEQADRGLQGFYPRELAKIIKLNKELKQEER